MGDVRFIMDLEAGGCLSVVTMAAKGSGRWTAVLRIRLYLHAFWADSIVFSLPLQYFFLAFGKGKEGRREDIIKENEDEKRIGIRGRSHAWTVYCRCIGCSDGA
jgi:hypothetical protein